MKTLHTATSLKVKHFTQPINIAFVDISLGTDGQPLPKSSNKTINVQFVCCAQRISLHDM